MVFCIFSPIIMVGVFVKAVRRDTDARRKVIASVLFLIGRDKINYGSI